MLLTFVPLLSPTAPYFVVLLCACTPWHPSVLRSTDRLPIRRVLTIAGSSTKAASPTRDLELWVHRHFVVFSESECCGGGGIYHFALHRNGSNEKIIHTVLFKGLKGSSDASHPSHSPNGEVIIPNSSCSQSHAALPSVRVLQQMFGLPRRPGPSIMESV